MPQRHLPLFPQGVTHITVELAFMKEGGRVTYFNGHMPVFIPDENDRATFRMITTQFCVNGNAKQADIVRAFGVTTISVKRSVKRYREKGPAGFYAPRPTRGPAVLIEPVVAEIEEFLAEGWSEAEIAERLGLKRDTLHKAVRAGKDPCRGDGDPRAARGDPRASRCDGPASRMPSTLSRCCWPCGAPGQWARHDSIDNVIQLLLKAESQCCRAFLHEQ